MILSIVFTRNVLQSYVNNAMISLPLFHKAVLISQQTVCKMMENHLRRSRERFLRDLLIESGNTLWIIIRKNGIKRSLVLDRVRRPGVRRKLTFPEIKISQVPLASARTFPNVGRSLSGDQEIESSMARSRRVCHTLLRPFWSCRGRAMSVCSFFSFSCLLAIVWPWHGIERRRRCSGSLAVTYRN